MSAGRRRRVRCRRARELGPPADAEYDELVLETLEREGEDATVARLLAKLDAVTLAVRRDHLYLLTIVPGAAALDWLEARIESPVVERWGVTAALLGIRWERIARWTARGRPHSLAALDALVAYALPAENCDSLHQEVQPWLADPPSMEELRRALDALVAVDDAPRVTMTRDEILARAGEILRAGPSRGVSPRTVFERDRVRAEGQRRGWAESQGPLPEPGHPLVAGTALRGVLRGRWKAVVRACERRGGSGEVTLGSTLRARERAAIERELGRALPRALAELFTEIAADVEVSWELPDGGDPPPPFAELGGAECVWDARRLPELEVQRRGWLDNAVSGGDEEFARVWMDKLAFLEVGNGDLIAVDVARPDVAPVVYLDHEGDEGHGRVLGHSILDFIDRWTRLGCVGPGHWSLSPFLRPEAPYLDAIGESAQRWRAWLGFDVLAAV